MNITETTSLVTDYLSTVNQAIDEHADDFPMKQLIRAGDKMLDGRNVGMAIYGKDPESPYDFYTVRFEDRALKLVAHGKEDVDVAWKVSDDYLHRVVDNREDYIAQPAKLDLGWLKTRVGLG